MKKKHSKLEESMDVQIEKLELIDGDVVVMRFNFPLEPEVMKGLSAKLYDSMPTGVRVLVVDPSVDIEKLHGPVAEAAGE